MRVGFCESCGAPLDAPWERLVVVCQYCRSSNVPDVGLVPQRVPVDGRPRLPVGGRTYVLDGRLARGDSCDVYQGRWVVRLGERVVVKVLRSLADADLLRREWDVLRRLQASPARGTEWFASLLPPPIAFGVVREARERPVAVFRWRSGFVHTLQEAGDVHDRKLDGRVAVWTLKRLLELLAWVHDSGVVHGAVLPCHVMVHPRDHGATLVGWSLATAWRDGAGEPLPAVPRRWRELYPDALLRGAPTDPATDVAMAARSIRWAARSLPHPIERLLDDAAAGRHPRARPLLRALAEASVTAYGPPAYNPLPMPGWPGVPA